MSSRDELAAFLRFRRERLTPEDAGLPGGGRRRTPGLRREEVATLAGVSTTWYTWLEQARDVTPSRQVLDALARTLQLSAAEHDYLFTLAGQPATRRPRRPTCIRRCGRSSTPSTRSPPTSPTRPGTSSPTTGRRRR
ncbi:hypothetical protein GCM10029978_106560 [Actinoallomurus acanthiterrae]